MLKKVINRHLPESVKIHAQAFDHYLNGEPELRLLDRLCPRGRVAVDIGANIGVYTYFLRKYASKVYAYEPNPDLAGRLVRLFSDVVVRNAACSDQIGNVTLRIPVKNGRPLHELASVSQSFDGESTIVSYEVRALTVDSEELSDVGFIKIDVEQHERRVLHGAMRTIGKWRPNLMVEVTPLLYSRPLPLEFEFVTEQGYEGWFRFGKNYYPFSEFRPELHANPATWGKSSMGGNVLFVPKELPVVDSRFQRRYT
jgi:FkbM family methyltransferase